MTVSFNKKFYHFQAVKRAVEAYKKVAVFKIKEKENNIEVNINDVDKDVKDIIKDEFCNYVLAETKRFK